MVKNFTDRQAIKYQAQQQVSNKFKQQVRKKGMLAYWDNDVVDNVSVKGLIQKVIR